MKKVGLFFGTFNPIHIGHLVLANHMVEFSDLDEAHKLVADFVGAEISPKED